MPTQINSFYSDFNNDFDYIPMEKCIECKNVKIFSEDGEFKFCCGLYGKCGDLDVYSIFSNINFHQYCPFKKDKVIEWIIMI